MELISTSGLEHSKTSGIIQTKSFKVTQSLKLKINYKVLNQHKSQISKLDNTTTKFYSVLSGDYVAESPPPPPPRCIVCGFNVGIFLLS